MGYGKSSPETYLTSDIVGQGTLDADAGDFLDCAALSISTMFDSEDTFVGTLAEFFDEFVLGRTMNVELRVVNVSLHWSGSKGRR